MTKTGKLQSCLSTTLIDQPFTTKKRMEKSIPNNPSCWHIPYISLFDPFWFQLCWIPWSRRVGKSWSVGSCSCSPGSLGWKRSPDLADGRGWRDEVLTWDLMVIFHGIYGGLMESNGIYPLVICYIGKWWCSMGFNGISWWFNGDTRPGYDCYSSPWKPWPIEIDDVPIKTSIYFRDFPWRTVK